MKIALLTDGIYPFVMGGMQKHSFYLAKYFAINKIEIDLYHCTNNLIEIDELNCFSKEEKKYINSIIIPFPKSGFFPGHYLRESFEYSNLIFQAYKKQIKSADFIYSQGFCGWKIINEKSKGVSLPPIGINFHGLEMYQKSPNLKSKLEQYIFKNSVLKLMQKSDWVFSLGGKLTDIILKLGIEKNKIIQIPIGIDELWIKTNPLKVNTTRKFIFIGRYERRKGVEELSKVIKQLLTIKKFEFEFIGVIPENKKIIADNVNYHGNITDVENIKKILSGADVLVCPSYSEGMPTVILEAMASGLAIIASNVGAIAEQVDGSNGRLITAGNITELKQTISAFIDIQEYELLIMKKHSIQLIKQHFLWEQIILKTIDSIKKKVSK